MEKFKYTPWWLEDFKNSCCTFCLALKWVNCHSWLSHVFQEDPVGNRRFRQCYWLSKADIQGRCSSLKTIADISYGLDKGRQIDTWFKLKQRCSQSGKEFRIIAFLVIIWGKGRIYNRYIDFSLASLNYLIPLCLVHSSPKKFGTNSSPETGRTQAAGKRRKLAALYNFVCACIPACCNR